MSELLSGQPVQPPASDSVCTEISSVSAKPTLFVLSAWERCREEERRLSKCSLQELGLGRGTPN